MPFMAMSVIPRPPATAGCAKARIVAHLFLEPGGTLSVTPTLGIDPNDEARLRAAVLKIGRWRSASERLWSAVLRSHGL
jgi:hypothetical protein